MVVRVEGNVIEVMADTINAEDPMLSTESPRVIELRCLHESKALFPIDVTLSPMTTVVSESIY